MGGEDEAHPTLPQASEVFSLSPLGNETSHPETSGNDTICPPPTVGVTTGIATSAGTKGLEVTVLGLIYCS